MASAVVLLLKGRPLGSTFTQKICKPLFLLFMVVGLSLLLGCGLIGGGGDEEEETTTEDSENSGPVTREEILATLEAQTPTPEANGEASTETEASTESEAAPDPEASAPAETKAPIKVIPEIAFEPDIKGVCKVAGTLLINSKPRKIERIKMNGSGARK